MEAVETPAIPIPRELRELWPRLAHRAAAMLASGELIQNPDGTFTRKEKTDVQSTDPHKNDPR